MADATRAYERLAELDGATLLRLPKGNWWARDKDGITIVLAAMSWAEAARLYGQLVEGHVSARAQAVAGIETNDTTAAAKIEVDCRIAQIDGVVDGAAKRGKANTAVDALKKTEQASLVQEQERIAREVPSLKADRAAAAAKGRAAEVGPCRSSTWLSYSASKPAARRRNGGSSPASWDAAPPSLSFCSASS